MRRQHASATTVLVNRRRSAVITHIGLLAGNCRCCGAVARVAALPAGNGSTNSMPSSPSKRYGDARTLYNDVQIAATSTSMTCILSNNKC